jgi:hypothetical protein
MSSLVGFKYQLVVAETMVEGGRNLESEILESFFEKLSNDDSIPEELVEELKRLERRGELSEATEVIDSAKEVMNSAHSGD